MIAWNNFLQKSCVLNVFYLRSFASCSSNKLSAPWKILFFGTDHFALESLKLLCSKLRTGTLISRLGVVSKSGSPVERFGVDEKLPILKWPVNSNEVTAEYDVGIVVSFGKMIPKSVIEAFPLGCVNVHASILPRWRGPAPIYHTIMSGDSETGVTIMRIHPFKFDVGEIVKQYRIPVSSHETTIELGKKLSVVGAELLMECVRDLPRCVQTAVPQPPVGVSHAPKIHSSMAKIRWADMNSRQLFNLHRALSHSYPLLTSWHGLSVRLMDVSSSQGLESDEGKGSSDLTRSSRSALAFLNESSEPVTNVLKGDANTKLGSVKYMKDEKCLQVSCKGGGFLIVRKVKISRKTQTARDFYNGFMSKRPKTEWYFSDLE